MARAGWDSRHVPLDVPADRLACRIGSGPEPALLEGGPGLGASGRWSIYTGGPRLVFQADALGWCLRRGEYTGATIATDPLVALDFLLRKFGLANPSDRSDPDAPPFQGGLIGFFGYDLAPRLERLPRRAPPDSRMPVIRFALYDWAVTVDHVTGFIQLSVFDLLGQGGLPARLESLRRGLEQSASRPPLPSVLSPPRGHFDRPTYVEAVGRALEYIRAGDIFQVNLSQRFDAFGKPEPLDLYLRLKSRSPAPFACFLRWDEFAVVGASPEWFYRTRGDHIVTRPIKGTRPRGATPEEDARLVEELQSSPKDRAELTMIVDLERNDLGRVCQYGTVCVSDPRAVETFAQVHHLVATIEGRLRPGAGPMDVVRAVFPGGSITGAPKIRAMQIIDELEPTRRGLYTGAVGYFSRGGASAFNIAIRTLLVEGDRVSYQVGGGIVADSDPEAEYEETLHKGRGLLEVVEGRGLSS